MRFLDLCPWAEDLNIGRVYNEAVNLLPEDCWAVIRDGDTMWLPEEWGNQVAAVIDEAEREGFGFVGVMTNRLGSPDQLHKGKFSNRHGAKEHKNIADRRWEQHGSTIKPFHKRIGGPVMIFPKAVWEKVGGFREGRGIAPQTDSVFAKAIRRKGGKVGIAPGLYVQHLYRPDCREINDARHHYHHLQR